MRKIKQAAELYYRLILVVAPEGAGKTTAFTHVKERTGAPLVNVNLELSRRMLELTERQRALRIPQLLREIVSDTASEVVLLDNLEILFDISLHQDPLRLLQGLSRNKTVVAAWNGKIVSDERKAQSLSLYITYAVSGHPEYRCYRVNDFLIATKYSDE